MCRGIAVAFPVVVGGDLCDVDLSAVVKIVQLAFQVSRSGIIGVKSTGGVLEQIVQAAQLHALKSGAVFSGLNQSGDIFAPLVLVISGAVTSEGFYLCFAMWCLFAQGCI